MYKLSHILSLCLQILTINNLNELVENNTQVSNIRINVKSELLDYLSRPLCEHIINILFTLYNILKIVHQT